LRNTARVEPVFVGLVGDVLARALLARALEADDRGEPLEAARDGAGQAVELVALDLQRQVGDAVVRAHAPEPRRLPDH
jgi:hypothetical protein